MLSGSRKLDNFGSRHVKRLVCSAKEAGIVADAKILIVEDEGIEALDIRYRLISLGYPEPDIAISGEEALVKVEETSPDLVLMDIMLHGGIDGVTVAEKIHDRFDIPVVYLTAYADDDTLRRAKITEPFGYLIKPFKERELHVTIDVALYKHRMERKLKESKKRLYTTLKSIGDAVIATDRNGLIVFMNPVAEDLMGWKLEDVSGSRLTEVFKIINRNTRQPVENPAARAMVEGIAVGLANHTVLIARNGSEIPIDDSAAPIKDDKGNIIGVILVFRDVTEREIAHEALRESEERFRLLVQEVQSYAIFMLDTEGRVASWNTGAEQIKGYGADEIIGRHIACFYTPENNARELPRQLLHRAATEGRSEDEGWRVRKDGSRFWANVVITALNDESGKLRGFSKVTRDITEHKRADEELHRSREWLRVTLSSIGDAVIATDTWGRITFLNPVAEALTGWSADNASSVPVQKVFRIIDEKTGKPAEDVVERVLSKGAIVNLANNTALITRDGREIPIEESAAPMEDSDGNIIGAVLVFHDVSEKRGAQEAIVQANEDWERTFRSIPDLIAILDDQHRVVRANPAMAERLGVTPDKCVGVPCYKAVHGMDRPPEFCPHASTLKDGCEHTSEVHEERLGGHFLVSTTPVYNNEGRITGSVHVARDITERRRMEDELRKAHGELELRVRERTSELSAAVERLELINQELREFAYIASHDLQEPLRKIQTFCDLICTKCGSGLDSTGQEYLDRVVSSASRMRQLLDDLLLFSRVAARPEPFQKVDLAKIVREAADVFETRLKETEGLIQIVPMPDIEADENQMLRLFQNLIGNALKYNSANSPRIRVHAKLDEQDFCEIYVEDNGIGFDRCFADRIFRPFQRLHNRGEYEGTGMGLAICRKIVERHGGSIRAESEPGKGSIFIIRLPLKHRELKDM